MTELLLKKQLLPLTNAIYSDGASFYIEATDGCGGFDQDAGNLGVIGHIGAVKCELYFINDRSRAAGGRTKGLIFHSIHMSCMNCLKEMYFKKLPE